MNSEGVRQSLKERQRQEREMLILQAAEKALMERGYHEMSMDEIAVEVGIAKSTVYLHFPKKEDLVVALIEQKMTQFLSLVVETMKQEMSAREKLELIFQRLYLQRVALTKGASLPLLINLYNSTDLRPLVTKVEGRIRELVKTIHDHLLTLLEEGQKTGEFDNVLPVEVMLGCFFSMVSPLTYERLIGERQTSLDDLVKYTKCMYFKSIAANTQSACD
ncbi:MAG: TetR/AcrR family transcriptional regulator [Ktedonobacteraceae bacterium]|nr:TetR/AcrR family transcriptional regulator [Ktedonobacteraceae bacterium]